MHCKVALPPISLLGLMLSSTNFVIAEFHRGLEATFKKSVNEKIPRGLDVPQPSRNKFLYLKNM